jgi:integrase
MPSTSSLTGIALSPVWHSIGWWSYGTGVIWNPGNWLRELSTSAWALCGGSPTKLPIAACSVRISRLAFGRVKGVKKLGVRLGNWLTAEQAHSLWQAPDSQGLKGKRDRALLALLLACGLRRHEAVGLRIDDLQQREEHWAIVDLVGKAGHVRTVPIPDWVKEQLDEWLRVAGIARGRIFRRVTRMGRTWGDCMTEKSIWHIVKDCAKRIGMPKLAPHDLRRTCARLCHASGGELEQIQFLLGHVSVQTTERYLGCKQRIRSAVNDRIGIEPNR